MNTTQENQPNGKVKSIRNFFWWSAGIVIPVLEKCSTEHLKYTAIGVVMVFISLVASFSFAFFLALSFDISVFPAMFGGLVWGFGLVFCLDRVLLTSFRKGEPGFVAIAQRFMLTIALSLIISEPLLMYFFRYEIELELINKGRTVVTTARNEVTSRFQTEVESLQNANNQIQTRLDLLKADRDVKENAVIGEVEGTSGSGKKGEGIAAKRKDVAFKEADTKYNEFKTESAEILKQNNARLAEMRTEIDDETKAAAKAKEQAKGVLARHEALFAIVKSDAGAALIYLPLFFGLLLLETLPLSVKVFGKMGVYDTALEAEEAKQIVEIKERNNFEKENLVNSRELQKKLAEKLMQIIINDEIETLRDENDIRTARTLKTEALRMTENEAFNRMAKLIDEEKFGAAIIFEVIGNEEFEFVCEVPKNAQRTLSLDTLSGDIARIAEKIGGNLRLAKAFSSGMREISANLPLLGQLGNDRKLLIEFETLGAT